MGMHSEKFLLPTTLLSNIYFDSPVRIRWWIKYKGDIFNIYLLKIYF